MYHTSNTAMYDAHTCNIKRHELLPCDHIDTYIQCVRMYITDLAPIGLLYAVLRIVCTYIDLIYKLNYVHTYIVIHILQDKTWTRQCEVAKRYLITACT